MPPIFTTHLWKRPGVARWSVYLCEKSYVSGLVGGSRQVCFGSVGIHQCGTSSARCCGRPIGQEIDPMLILI